MGSKCELCYTVEISNNGGSTWQKERKSYTFSEIITKLFEKAK